jgi:hypothetical protein
MANLTARLYQPLRVAAPPVRAFMSMRYILFFIATFLFFCERPPAEDDLHYYIVYYYPQAKLIMKFPNNSVSFIPDGHWYGGNKHAGCYNEKNTHMILIIYESTNIGNLRPIDQHTLESKLAAWYLHKTPKRNHTRENIKYC